MAPQKGANTEKGKFQIANLPIPSMVIQDHFQNKQTTRQNPL